MTNQVPRYWLHEGRRELSDTEMFNLASSVTSAYDEYINAKELIDTNEEPLEELKARYLDAVKRVKSSIEKGGHPTEVERAIRNAVRKQDEFVKAYFKYFKSFELMSTARQKVDSLLEEVDATINHLTVTNGSIFSGSKSLWKIGSVKIVEPMEDHPFNRCWE